MKTNLVFLWVLFLCCAMSAISLYQSKPMDDSVFLSIKQSINEIKTIYQTNPMLITILFCTSFFIFTLCYIPFTGSLYALFAGVLFEFYKGTILFSFLVSTAYTASFLISKHIFFTNYQKKLNSKTKNIIQGFERNGWIYLLSLRVAGVLPATLINTVMGVTSIPTWQYYLVTHLGTIPHIIAYTNTSSKMEQLKNIQDLNSQHFFLFLIVLSFFPILLKIILELIFIRNYKK